MEKILEKIKASFGDKLIMVFNAEENPDIVRVIENSDFKKSLFANNIIVSSKKDDKGKDIFVFSCIKGGVTGKKKEEVKEQKPVLKEDDGFIETPEFHKILKICRNVSPLNLFFVGPHGCGKTETAKKISEILFKERVKDYKDVPKDRETNICFNGSSGQSYRTIIEDKYVKEGEKGGCVTGYQDGFVIKAMNLGLNKKGEEIGPGGVLIIDEFCAIPSEVLIGINTVLADPKPQREFRRANGEIVRSHKDFVVMATANTFGRGTGEMEYLYSAQNQTIDASTLDRFHATFTFGYNPDVERTLLEKHIEKADVDKLMVFAEGTRKSVEEGKMELPVSTRQLLNVAKLGKAIGLEEAIFHGIFCPILGDKVLAKAYNEIYQRVVGEDILKY